MTSVDKALVGQYGVYHVASLLCWKGYNAVPTSRNTKAVDLIVHNPRNDKSVGIQVKTLRQQRKRDPSKDGYAIINVIPEKMNEVKDKFSNPFVFVYIPTGEKPNPRCFIVPKEDVFKLCKEQWERYVRESKHRESTNEIAKRRQVLGILVKELESYENKWDQLGLE